MESIAKKITRLATALHNACNATYRSRQCNQCPFNIQFGCTLYGHPIEWEDKLKEAKTSER